MYITNQKRFNKLKNYRKKMESIMVNNISCDKKPHHSAMLYKK